MAWTKRFTTRLSIKKADFFQGVKKGVAFQQLSAVMSCTPYVQKISVFMCKKKRFNEVLGGGTAHRPCSWSHSGSGALPPARRKLSLLMTAQEPVTLGSLHQSELAPRASPASCPLPSVSQSATGASCHPRVTTRPAPGSRVFRQPGQIELSVLTAPSELLFGRRRINKLQADRQSSTSLNKKSKPRALHSPVVRHQHKCWDSRRCCWGCSWLLGLTKICNLTVKSVVHGSTSPLRISVTSVGVCWVCQRRHEDSVLWENIL